MMGAQLGAGQSALAVAIWHAAYNMAAATAASSGMVAGIASALIIVQAVVLLRLHERELKRARAPVLGPEHVRSAAR
jgi:hypothetical protein